METEINTVKRSKHFAVLSRQHYDGLLFVSKLLRGLDDCIPVEALRIQCKVYWKDHLYPHFLQEEKILLQYISPHDSLAIQLRSEHDNIRELIVSIDHTPSLRTIGILADIISRHIHFEENIFFRYMEEKLSLEQLDAICKQLESEK